MRYPLTSYTRGEMGRRSVSQTRDAAFRVVAPNVVGDGFSLKSMAHPTAAVMPTYDWQECKVGMGSTQHTGRALAERGRAFFEAK